MTAMKKMIRFSRCMGGRTRNSTPKPARGAGNASRRAARPTAARVATLTALLAEKWPDAVVELDHRNAFELLAATILAAQSTDKTINTITPALFAKYPDAHALSARPRRSSSADLQVGFYRNKAKSLLGWRARWSSTTAASPDTMEALVALPGSRARRNVVLAVRSASPPASWSIPTSRGSQIASA